MRDGKKDEAEKIKAEVKKINDSKVFGLLNDIFGIAFFVNAVYLLAENFDMMPQDIVYIGCCGQTLPADSFEYFQTL